MSDTGSSMGNFTRETRIERIGVLFILAVAALVRFQSLGQFSFWDDEVSYINTAADLGALVSGQTGFKGPMLFLAALNLWSRISDNPYFLLILPATIGVLSVWVMYRFGKELFNPLTGQFAAMLLALSPMNVYYSQELKSYSLVMLLTLSSSLLFMRIVSKPAESRFWILYAITNAALLYTQYVCLLLLCAHCVFFLIYRRHYSAALRPLIKAYCLSILLFSPWLIVVILTNLSKLSSFLSTWIPPWTWSSPLITIYHLAAGYHSPRKIGVVLMVIALLLIVRGFWMAWHSDAKNQRNVLFVFLTLIVPIFVASLAAQWKNVYLDRYLMFISGPFLLLVGLGFASCKRRSTLLLLTLSVGLLHFMPLALVHLNRIPREGAGLYMKKDVRAVTAFLTKSVQPGDTIIHSSSSCMNIINYYRTPLPPLDQHYVVLMRREFDRFENYVEATKRYNPNLLPRFLPTFLLDSKRIWLVHSSWATSFEDHEPRMIREWMFAYYQCIGSWHYYAIDIFLLTPRTNESQLQNP